MTNVTVIGEAQNCRLVRVCQLQIWTNMWSNTHAHPAAFVLEQWLTHSLTHSLTNSLAHSLTHSLLSFTPTPTQALSYAHPFIYTLIHSLTLWLTQTRVHTLTLTLCARGWNGRFGFSKRPVGVSFAPRQLLRGIHGALRRTLHGMYARLDARVFGERTRVWAIFCRRDLRIRWGKNEMSREPDELRISRNEDKKRRGL